MSNNSQVNKEYEKFEKWFHESQIENSLFPNVMKLFDTSKDILQEAYQAGANASGCAKLLTEQDYKYNKQTNELIARHAEQLEVAAEFCRQYQIENKQLKADAEADNETNLQLNLEIMTLKAENKKLGDYYMKINSMYWNDEIVEVNHGKTFYTDEFVKIVAEF